MSKVKVGKGRSQIENVVSGLKITIPTKKNYFTIFFLAFWLAGWMFGEMSALSQVFNPESGAPKLFMIVWLSGWTIGGAFAIYSWLWNINGKEIVNISSNELQYIRQVIGFKRSKEYDLSLISKLRSQGQNNSVFGKRNSMDFWGISGGSVAFDYGKSTHRFGAQLDEAEAEYIVNTIKQRFRNL